MMKENKTYYITTALCGFFFIAQLITHDSYKYAAIPLAFVAVLFFYKAWPMVKNRQIVSISLALSGYFIITLLSWIIYGGNTSQLDMPSRVLFSIFIMSYILRFPPTKAVIFYAISLGALISGSIGVYQYLTTSLRAFSFDGYMVIQSGGQVTLLSLLAFISILYGLYHQKRTLTLLSGVGFAIALASVFLSGSRGSWVPLPFIMLFLLFQHRRLISQKLLLIFISLFIVLGIVAHPVIDNRINNIANDLTQYEHGDKGTSSGIRLELWKSALYSAMEKPIFGQGFDEGLKAAKERQIEKGLVAPFVVNLSRAHNQFLEDLQTKGLIGLFTLLCFFGVPLSYFIKAFRRSTFDDDCYYFSLAGIVYVTSVVGFCLTQHYLAHNSGIIIYSVGVSILSALTLLTQSELSKTVKNEPPEN